MASSRYLRDLSSVADETTIRLDVAEGWDDTVTIKREFGKRSDEEPKQPLIYMFLTSGEDAAEQFECWLTLPEARKVRDRLDAAINQQRVE